MSLLIETSIVACSLSTGLQTITNTNLGGATPKAVKIELIQVAAEDTKTAHASLLVGICDGTNVFSISGNSEDAVATTDAVMNCMGGPVGSYPIMRISRIPGVVGQEGNANFDSFVADGCKINWTDTPSSAYLMRVTFFAGDDILNAEVNYLAGPTLSGTASYDTAGGFTPNYVEFHYGRGNMSTSPSESNWYHSNGVAIDTGSGTEQTCFRFTDRDYRSSTTSFGALHDDRIVSVYTWAGTHYYHLTLDSWDTGAGSEGFTIREQGLRDISTQDVGFLAIEFSSDVKLNTTTHTMPTGGTGLDAQTGIGFQPQYALAFHMLNTAINEHDTGWWQDWKNWSVWSANHESTIQLLIEDGQATTDNKTWISQDALVSRWDNSQMFRANFSSFDADGFTLDWNEQYAASKYRVVSIGLQLASTHEDSLSLGGSLGLTQQNPLLMDMGAAMAQQAGYADQATASLAAAAVLATQNNLSALNNVFAEYGFSFALLEDAQPAPDQTIGTHMALPLAAGTSGTHVAGLAASVLVAGSAAMSATELAVLQGSVSLAHVGLLASHGKLDMLPLADIAQSFGVASSALVLMQAALSLAVDSLAADTDAALDMPSDLALILSTGQGTQNNLNMPPTISLQASQTVESDRTLSLSLGIDLGASKVLQGLTQADLAAQAQFADALALAAVDLFRARASSTRTLMVPGSRRTLTLKPGRRDIIIGSNPWNQNKV
jgi:hypothetical protein